MRSKHRLILQTKIKKKKLWITTKKIINLIVRLKRSCCKFGDPWKKKRQKKEKEN